MHFDEDNIGISIESFSKWISVLCVVDFDVDIGQIVKESFPYNSISESDELTIAQDSFPPSSVMDNLSDTTFFTKFCLSLSHVGENVEHFAYIYHHQEANPKRPRGYDQKSIVMLSALPFLPEFLKIVTFFGKIFWEEKDIDYRFLLENFALMVSEWPSPDALYDTSKVILPVFAKAFEINTKRVNDVFITNPTELPISFGFTSMISTCSVFGSNFQRLCRLNVGVLSGISMFPSIFSVINHLWFIFELLLTNQPILVVGNSPEYVSNVVILLSELLQPLPFPGILKPFVTAGSTLFHDPTISFQQGLYGCSNVMLAEWFSHVLYLSPPDNPKGPLLSEAVLVSTYRPTLNPDKSLIAEINRLLLHSPSTAERLLRSSFSNFMRKFLKPFGHCFELPKPNAKPELFFSSPPSATSFSEKQFNTYLEKNYKNGFEAGISWKNLKKIYKMFCDGINFAKILELQSKLITKEMIYEQHRMNIIKTDISGFMSTLSEIKLVQVVVQIQKLLKTIDSSDVDMINALEKHYEVILSYLPDDTRESILLSKRL
eukprot:TRINITY_DN1109_c0_g1_i1.p1 TRINITY_DN1109_c0_g1~~TRINITY_DN1109_c0_g1_i1.p1  ORF type:complete len:546 (+),score=124.74 TRINITY_DN1109_c0_g1_i1:59-1696(+)